MTTRIAALSVAFVVALASTCALAAASCNAPAGGKVVLESDAVDPDVFLWDSRPRLIDYAAGEWNNTKSIFAHTLLAEPGTLATVISCVAGVAHPKFGDGVEDAIGVKIASGPYKGRYGWILSSDMHMRPPGAAPGSLVNYPKDVRR